VCSPHAGGVLPGGFLHGPSPAPTTTGRAPTGWFIKTSPPTDLEHFPWFPDGGSFHGVSRFGGNGLLDAGEQCDDGRSCTTGETYTGGTWGGRDRHMRAVPRLRVERFVRAAHRGDLPSHHQVPRGEPRAAREDRCRPRQLHLEMDGGLAALAGGSRQSARCGRVHALHLSSEPTDVLLFRATALAGGTCRSKPCWRTRV